MMDGINLLLISVTIFSAFLGFTLIFHGRGSRISTAYAANVVAILCWMASMFFYRNSLGDSDVIFWVIILYISATLIASSFLFFTHFFPESEPRLNIAARSLLIFLPNVVLIFVIALTPFVIQSAHANRPHEPIIIFGQYYALYVVYILGYFSYGFYRLIAKFVKSDDQTRRNQIKYLLLGYMVATSIAFVSNLFLPWFGVFTLNWLGQVSGIIMVIFATYAIFRYKLFNVRVATTEFLTFSLWAFILIRAIFSETVNDQNGNLALFFVSLIFGIFLIRSVIKEVRQREEIQKLAENLERANAQLREVDQMKSEFISLATHQIRSPLTAIKGYSSLILEGDYGEAPKQIRDVVKIIFDSCQNLVVIVNEFLDISRIEQGRMKYDKSDFEMLDLVKETIEELLPNVEQAKLGIEFHHGRDETYHVYADRNKVKQVVSNLIDNAIKYTPQGGITVKLGKRIGKVVLAIEDTGVGIDPAEKDKLFAMFTRAKDANKINVTGTGLGLYVARQMMQAQGGEIWVESPGKGKGSTFFVELLESGG
ncbi:MAG TPA: ATP-binding protein [Candidatus Paceibacterota bacterium]|nr:ATP-binding protein [Candidatus Paceibacterota bacterium]